MPWKHKSFCAYLKFQGLFAGILLFVWFAAIEMYVLAEKGPLGSNATLTCKVSVGCTITTCTYPTFRQFYNGEKG